MDDQKPIQFKVEGNMNWRLFEVKMELCTDTLSLQTMARFAPAVRNGTLPDAHREQVQEAVAAYLDARKANLRAQLALAKGEFGSQQAREHAKNRAANSYRRYRSAAEVLRTLPARIPVPQAD